MLSRVTDFPGIDQKPKIAQPSTILDITFSTEFSTKFSTYIFKNILLLNLVLKF
jgi:hypothetical protein